MLPTLWSLVLAARGMPPLHLFAIFITGSFVMRSAGVVLNDLADRSFDRHVTRTRVRPLASGELSVTHALLDRKSTRLNSSHIQKSRMPSSA